MTSRRAIDESAWFEELFTGQYPDMVRLARFLTGDRSVAEDLVQEAFARVYGLERPENPPGYLRAAVVNGCRNWHRSGRRSDAKLLRHGLGEQSVSDRARELDATLMRLPYRERVVMASAERVEAPAFDPIELTDANHKNRRGSVSSFAVAALVLALVGGFVALSRSGDTTVATDPGGSSVLPPDGPVLLTVGVRGPAVSASDARLGPFYSEPRGTVASPDGTVFGLALSKLGNETIPGDRIKVAGFDVVTMADGSAPTQIYRTVDLDCSHLIVTTADAPVISPEFAALLEAISQKTSSIAIDLPSGWESFGAAVSVEHYTSRFRLDAGPEQGAEIDFQQAPGTPIGYWLGGGETAPVLLSDDGTDQLWWVEGATTPGLHTLIGTRFGTLFRLSGMVPVEELRAVADNLVQIGSAPAIETNNLAPPGEEMTVESNPLAWPGCSPDPLGLIIQQ